MCWGLGVLCKDPGGVGVSLETSGWRSRAFLAETTQGCARKTTALGAEPGAQLPTHRGAGRSGGLGGSDPPGGAVRTLLSNPSQPVRCPGDKPFLGRLCLVGMQPQSPPPPAVDGWAGQ